MFGVRSPARSVGVGLLRIVWMPCTHKGDLAALNDYRDDEGIVKLWDMRKPEACFKIKIGEDNVADMITNETQKYLVCAGGDGALTSIDLKASKIYTTSEEYDSELTCLGLFRSETKLLVGSSKGKLYLFNWKEFGLHSDEYIGHKHSISCMMPITQNVVVTSGEDGVLRAAHMFPHRQLGVVGQHSMPVERLDISHDGRLLASCSLDSDVKFWNISYFEEIENIIDVNKKQNKKKDMSNNLPSSSLKNASDFFSGLGTAIGVKRTQAPSTMWPIPLLDYEWDAGFGRIYVIPTSPPLEFQVGIEENGNAVRDRDRIYKGDQDGNQSVSVDARVSRRYHAMLIFTYLSKLCIGLLRGNGRGEITAPPPAPSRLLRAPVDFEPDSITALAHTPAGYWIQVSESSGGSLPFYHLTLPPIIAPPSCILFLTREVGNAMVTLLRLRVSMFGDDHLRTYALASLCTS
ncbi:WD repeat-containing protein 55 homolog [Eumeta japonica]|uniref:WD repeat-containing protein 55 homolog n=1 Tax=Eumeta variegata TaxID=151549 RepID=A0A4C1VRA2_EUMVA|nr:WD repeat-containing protein 55 homolog [Eumeta japonica]